MAVELLTLPHTVLFSDMLIWHHGNRFSTEIHTEWQRPLFGVHSIMMDYLVQPGEGGGARPPPFTLFTITYKVAVYGLA